MPEFELRSFWLQSWNLSCLHAIQSRALASASRAHDSRELEAWALEG